MTANEEVEGPRSSARMEPRAHTVFQRPRRHYRLSRPLPTIVRQQPCAKPLRRHLDPRLSRSFQYTSGPVSKLRGQSTANARMIDVPTLWPHMIGMLPVTKWPVPHATPTAPKLSAAATTVNNTNSNAQISHLLRALLCVCVRCSTGCCLTNKLRGRTTAPDKRRGRTLSTGARGDTTAFHGPFQRLLESPSCSTNRSRPSDLAKGPIALVH